MAYTSICLLQLSPTSEVVKNFVIELGGTGHCTASHHRWIWCRAAQRGMRDSFSEQGAPHMSTFQGTCSMQRTLGLEILRKVLRLPQYSKLHQKAYMLHASLQFSPFKLASPEKVRQQKSYHRRALTFPSKTKFCEGNLQFWF